METIGNINKDITTDPNHIRVNHKGVFLGVGVSEALGLSDGQYIEFARDRSRYLYLKKGNPNYGYRLKKVGKRLYTNNAHLAREIAAMVYKTMRNDFEPFVLLTTQPEPDAEGNISVEVFTSKIFRTRMYYEKTK